MANVTPAELRRLADRKRAEARSLSASADRLRPEAAALRGLFEPLVALSTRVWIGPAAEEFEQSARYRGRLLDQEADRLLRLAQELTERSRRLLSEATGLLARATAAEAAEAAAISPPGDLVGTPSGSI